MENYNTSHDSKMAVKKQMFSEAELCLLQCEEGDTPSKFAVNALCLTFAVSKFCFLTSIDFGDPVPNVGACHKRCFSHPC